MTLTYETTIKTRVERTLCQLDYTAVPVTDHGDGRITLSCIDLEPGDVCIARAAAKCVAGVTAVTVKRN
ncbi:hypothetical protein [Planctomycetes bacterium K23_9]|uniref:Uncharacterized protein n=1 Tax=Stieleria marina TaxID=1930275 RepID=A0A517NV05_9BACT|nr:hypothetical protein K239x_29440 [Planctomycetes bacterium K23_9]